MGFLGVMGTSEKGQERERTKAGQTALRKATLDIIDD
jgi:hypothetical protein